jgi:Ca2+-binding RTX toxin-like protein
VSVFGTPGDDVMRVGADRSGASVMDLGPDLDQDVTITAASDISLVGGDGADVLSGQGFDDFAEARLPLGFSGGSGDDHIFGGLGVDHFSGNAGNDTLVTADGQPELVSGGPDTDSDVRDGGDTLSSSRSPSSAAGRSAAPGCPPRRCALAPEGRRTWA